MLAFVEKKNQNEEQHVNYIIRNCQHRFHYKAKINDALIMAFRCICRFVSRLLDYKQVLRCTQLT